MKTSNSEVAAASIESKLHSGPEAFERFKDFTRRVVAVPKSEVDRKLAAAKKGKAQSGNKKQRDYSIPNPS